MKKKIRALIINLEKEILKCEKMKEQMHHLEIFDFEVFSAVDGIKVNTDKNGGKVTFNDSTYEYSIYTGDMNFRKQYLNPKEVGCALSHNLLINNQIENYHTIIFEDDAHFVGDIADWENQLAHLPQDDDYDIIFLSDCGWRSAPYPTVSDYNKYYSFLPYPYFNYSGTHSYIVNPKIVSLLNKNFKLNLAADDYLSYCINKFGLRALVSKNVLFTQAPEKYLKNIT